MSESIRAKFWARVDKRGADDCWLWKAGQNGRGYGQLGIGKKRDGSYQIDYAHRIAFALVNGPIEEGLFVCHRCDVPLCCNPSHLFLGTPADNMRDRDAKHRHVAARGARHWNATLIDDDVMWIRWAREYAGSPGVALSKAFGVSQGAISCIASGKSWKHI